jgi:hypothetical protein
MPAKAVKWNVDYLLTTCDLTQKSLLDLSPIIKKGCQIAGIQVELK